jgi:hypothetical protein
VIIDTVTAQVPASEADNVVPLAPPIPDGCRRGGQSFYARSSASSWIPGSSFDQSATARFESRLSSGNVRLSPSCTLRPDLLSRRRPGSGVRRVSVETPV